MATHSSVLAWESHGPRSLMTFARSSSWTRLMNNKYVRTVNVVTELLSG